MQIPTGPAGACSCQRRDDWFSRKIARLSSDPLKKLLRSLRGWFYRSLPSRGRSWHTKRLAGLDRRWKLEGDGFTKEGFFQILHHKFLQEAQGGLWLELRVGDGLVGSLGSWLESSGPGWQVEAWEDRKFPFERLRSNRPRSRVVGARLTDWAIRKESSIPDGIATRGVREASAVCRAVRQQNKSPRWIGIWNPSRRPVWAQRLQACGYRLELAWHNMEFYRLSGRRKSVVGFRKTEDRGRTTDDGRRKAVLCSR